MTREEAKELLTYIMMSYVPKDQYGDYDDPEPYEQAIDMAIEALSDGWIPCSEGLPEEHEWVGTKKFGTTISDKVHITFDLNGERFVKTLSLQNGELSNYEKRTMDTFYKGWKMLAWKPLPDPYREDGE